MSFLYNRNGFWYVADTRNGKRKLTSTKTKDKAKAMIIFNQMTGYLPELDRAIPSDNGYLYAIGNEANSLIKIGISVDIKKRILQLGCASPVKLNLLHCIKVNNMVEAEMIIHDKFLERRQHGEWFDISLSDFLECIKEFLPETIKPTIIVNESPAINKELNLRKKLKLMRQSKSLYSESLTT